MNPAARAAPWTPTAWTATWPASLRERLARLPRRDVSHESARPVPDWVASAVVYEVNVRAFSPEGTLAGVTRQLDRLASLGVDVLWLMPIHPVGRVRAKGPLGSPYAVRDHLAIDPALGTSADLRRLVDAAHARGLRVLLDLVAGHTAWDAALRASPECYLHREGEILSPIPEWSDVAALDYGCLRVREYMLDVATFWVREFDIDGYRCDAAMLVPADFWRQARTRLDQLRPDLFLLAEAAEPELLTAGFDADYAWPFRHALAAVLQGHAPARVLREAWTHEQATWPRGALHLRFLDNHDEPRAIVRFGDAPTLAAMVLLFLLDGLPLVYNGMEVGDTAESRAPALFERRPISWEGPSARPGIGAFFRELISLRRCLPARGQGPVEWLPSTREDRIAAFLRRSHGGADTAATGSGETDILVVLNLSPRPWRGAVEVPRSGPWEDVTPRVPGRAMPRDRDPADLALGPWEFRVLASPPA